VDPAQFFDSHRERWSLVLPSWLACVVLSSYFSYKMTIDSNLHDSLGYGEACSLYLNVEVLCHHVYMRFMVMFNYDHLVVENDDTKNS
jgi:hypothetical protein